MGDTTKPAGMSGSESSLGLSLTAGAGYAARYDGTTMASGPQFEVGLGPRIQWGPNQFLFNASANFLALQRPLFGRKDADWVKTFVGQFGYGRVLNPNLTLRAELGLGASVYGEIFNEQLQNGVYLKERAAAAHLELGAGACFWNDRFCGLLQYTHDFLAYRSQTVDSNRSEPNLTTRSVDTNGFGLLIFTDLGRFF
jgi:hypothetical protein